MIVRNRKTLREYEITKEDYAKLVERKIHRSFEILDNTDTKLKGKVLIPKEIVEYQAKLPKDLKIKTTPEKPKK